MASTTSCEAEPRWLSSRTPTYVRNINANVMAQPPLTAQTIAPERPFMSLPLHVVADILSHLGDVRHLPNALLTHPIFHAAYKDFPSLSGNALRNEISDDEVYTLALIAYESDPARRAKNGLTATSFLATYRDMPSKLIEHRRVIRLYEALRMGEFHSSVVELRDSFIDGSLRKLHGITDTQQSLPDTIKELSVDELKRIERALYRYQIYCNLFSDQFRNGQEETESKRIFFDKHSMWANEQLGCVYDFLESELQLAIDQVAHNSVDRAEWLLEGAKGKKKQHFLSLGLPWLHQLFNAASPEAQFDLLCNAKDFEGSNDKIAPAVPPTPFTEQKRAADRENIRIPGNAWIEGVNSSFNIKDTDNGPERIWKDIHDTGKSGTGMVVDQAFALRRLGYVMWDGKRLDREACRESIRITRADITPTFVSPSRFMNPVRVWDPQFRSRQAAPTGAGRRQGGARPFVRRAAAPKAKAAKSDQPESSGGVGSSSRTRTLGASSRSNPRPINIPSVSLGIQAVAGSTVSTEAS